MQSPIVVGMFLVFFSCPVMAQVEKQTVMLPMSDGVNLATDIYNTSNWTTGPGHTVRSPYAKDNMGSMATTLASQGRFALVVQDTRGRFDSEGVDTVFRDDATDGAETVAWLREQDFCDGRIGTYGMSALGITSYLLAGQNPDGLLCQWVEMAAPDLYRHVAFPGGVMRTSLIEGWLQSQGSLHVLEEWVAHANLDPYWDPVRLAGLYGQVNARAVHLAGWYDVFLQGSLDAFGAYQTLGGEGAQAGQILIVGPWTHVAWSASTQGELTYPINSVWSGYLYAGSVLGWFAHCLLGTSTQAASWPQVRYYLMGDVDDPDAPGNAWIDADTWPPEGVNHVPYYLTASGGLVAGTAPTDDGSRSLTSDPTDPVPTRCGNNLMLADGPCDQSNVEARPDVLVYTSEVLIEPIEVTGRIWLQAFFSADTPDCDLMVRLSDVYPDGRSMLVIDGALQARHRQSVETEEFLTPGEVVEGWVDLWSTAIVFNTGHRIRVSISGSNSPRFEVNPQTGEAFRQHTFEQAARIEFQHNPQHPTALLLPIMGAEPIPDGGSDAGPGDADGGVDGGSVDPDEDGQEPDSDGDTQADSGTQTDGGTGSDAGTEPASESGCGCQGPDSGLASWWWLGLIGLAAFSRNRRLHYPGR